MAGFLLAFTLSLPGQSLLLIGSVEFEGNDELSFRELADALPFRSGTTCSDSLLTRGTTALLSLYHARGFYGADVQLSKTPGQGVAHGVDIIFRILEGPKSTVGKILLEGNHAIRTERLLELFDLKPGDVFDVTLLEADIGNVLDMYEEAGYPLAALSLRSVIPSAGGKAGGLDLTLAVDEGGPVEIVEMRVEGTTGTRDEVILRESRITPPERYDPIKSRRFQERLKRLGIFSSVEEPVLYTTGAGGGLLVRVSEGRTSTFDGIIGYVPSTTPGDGGGSVTGMARISMRNLFGTARRFEAEWARDPASTQEISLSYEEPWVLGFPVNLGGRFYQRQQDSSYVERMVGGEAVILVTTSLSVSAVVEGRNIIPSETAGLPAPQGSSTFAGGIVLRLDTRDDRYSPRGGLAYESGYRVGTKKMKNTASSTTGDDLSGTVRHLGLDLDAYIGTLRNQVLNLGFHARQLWSPFPEPADLYRLGGFRGLRGFRENRFPGSRMAWSVVEYRFLSTGRSFFYGFFDTGYIYSPFTDPPDILTFGYGVGMRLETALGIIAVSFALGQGDPVSETKIHFGLVNDF